MLHSYCSSLMIPKVNTQRNWSEVSSSNLSDICMYLWFSSIRAILLALISFLFDTMIKSGTVTTRLAIGPGGIGISTGIVQLKRNQFLFLIQDQKKNFRSFGKERKKHKISKFLFIPNNIKAIAKIQLEIFLQSFFLPNLASFSISMYGT